MKTRKDILKIFEESYKKYGKIGPMCPYFGNGSVSCRQCLWTATNQSCEKELEELRKIAERRVKLNKLLGSD